MLNSTCTPRGAHCLLAPATTLLAPTRSLPRLAPLVLLLGMTGLAPAAHAGPSDAVHVYGSVGYFHDDNLFRISDDQPAFDGQRGDSARQTVIGLIFDKFYGRQRVVVQAKRAKVTFDHFSRLDYDGKDYMGTLTWQLGNHLDGTMGASYLQSLAPYTDFTSNERNLRVQSRQFFDGGWRFHPAGKLRTAFSHDKYTYDLSLQRFNNRTEDAFELGADYLPSTNSTVGIVARRLRGHYPNRLSQSQLSQGADYTQTELKARATWAVTKITNVQVLAGYAKRDRDGDGGNSEAGLNGRVSVSSQTRAKLRLGAAVWREFTPVESYLVTYALSNGASVTALYDITAKIRLDALLSTEKRAFQERVSTLTGLDLTDRVRRASLNAVWNVRPAIAFNGGVTHEHRAGALALGTGSYKVTTVSINANAQF